MSSFKAPFVATILLGAALAVSACGYTPLYGRSANQTAVTQDLSHITVAPIADRPGQMMRTAMERRLSPRGGREKLYTLHITLDETLRTLAEQRSGFVTRANLTVEASYRLVPNTEGSTLTRGTVKSVASYNILSSDYATLVAKDDARERAIKNLADTIHTRLGIYFKAQGPEAERSGQ